MVSRALGSKALIGTRALFIVLIFCVFVAAYIHGCMQRYVEIGWLQN